MTREERAKQFMPFDAMKGLSEALRDREERHLRVDKREITDEAAEMISDALTRLERGMRVEIEYHHAFHDLRSAGIITDISYAYKFLKLDDCKIYFDEIYDIIVSDYS